MGVMQCDRQNCENIMCNRLSDEYCYICDRCFDELVGQGPTVNISSFMETLLSASFDAESRARYDAAFPFMS